MDLNIFVATYFVAVLHSHFIAYSLWFSSTMVIKKDPRVILELLSRPVDVDDDEFLDKMDPNVSQPMRCCVSDDFFSE